MSDSPHFIGSLPDDRLLKTRTRQSNYHKTRINNYDNDIVGERTYQLRPFILELLSHVSDPYSLHVGDFIIVVMVCGRLHYFTVMTTLHTSQVSAALPPLFIHGAGQRRSAQQFM